MAIYSEIVGATNFKRKQTKQDAEALGTYVISVSNEIKEKLVDGDAFETEIELNDELFKLAIKQRSNLKKWHIAIKVGNGTTLMVGKVIGVINEEKVDDVEKTVATCLMSNGAYLVIIVEYDVVDKTFYATLSSKGLVGGIEEEEITVELSIESGANYASRTYDAPISLKKFIENCENGVYTTTGTVARFSKLIRENTRIVLIGVDKDAVLDGTAKTTWQFLDSPIPTTIYPCTSPTLLSYGSSQEPISILNGIINGTLADNVTNYPLARGSYLTFDVFHRYLALTYEKMPSLLQKHIKLAYRKYNVLTSILFYAPKDGNVPDPEPGTNWQYLFEKVFILSARDYGENFGRSGEGNGSAYDYLTTSANRTRYNRVSNHTNLVTTSYRTSSTEDEALSDRIAVVTSQNTVTLANSNNPRIIIPAFCI